MTKYSLETKIAAVPEILDGSPQNAVGRKFHIPRKVVRRWYANYLMGGWQALQKTNQSYSQDFKLDVVSFYLSNSVSYLQTAACFGISNEGVVCQWVKRYQEQGVAGIETTHKGRPPTMSKTAKPEKSLTREEQLEKENAYLRMEVEY